MSAVFHGAFPLSGRGRHAEVVIAELNGWPACPSVNASPKALRSRRMTRGQDGSLALSCTALSSATPCRFIPALTPTPFLAWVDWLEQLVEAVAEANRVIVGHH